MSDTSTNSSTAEVWRGMLTEFRAVRAAVVLGPGESSHAARSRAFEVEFRGALAFAAAKTPEGRNAWADALKAMES